MNRATYTPKVLWVVGPPGVGKTSIVRELLGPLDQLGLYLVGSPKWTVLPDICAAGHYTGQTFDGADTVPYNGAKAALEYWEKSLSKKPLTIFDGDRFSNKGVVDWFKGKAVRACIHVTTDDATLKARRAGRGSNQNASWMKGRVTKAYNFWFSNFAKYTDPTEPWGAEAALQPNEKPTRCADFIRDWLRKL